MIKKLKIRFIILAMISLVVLLSLIVAGMNIANYRNVVSDADTRIEVLEENSGRLFGGPSAMVESAGNNGNMNARAGGNDEDDRAEFDAGDPDYIDSDDDNNNYFGPKGPGGPSMSRDEAEESRFFMVIASQDGDIQSTNVARISSVDESEAASMAKEALASGNDTGFIDDFRYSVNDFKGGKRVTFLDCGRTLATFREFLRASILMSLIGLLAVFFVILYFAGRIVKPVAESYEKQKRFITDASHEIKTPLAIIKANIDLMDMELDSAETGKTEEDRTKAVSELRESLGDINDQVDRLTGLTNDLVYLSRMEEAENSLVMTEVPISDIVEETVSSFEPLAAEKGKEISKEIEPMVTVQGSSKELEKLVSILMENAIKYSIDPRRIELKEDECGMPAPPLIHVSFNKEGRNAVLRIFNRTENELTNESLSHVLERFYREDSSRNSETGGHGIGLSMASAIVNAHGGEISAKTTDGHDFIVTATIPLA